MTGLLVLALLALAEHPAPDPQLEAAAVAEVRELIRDHLMGHYDVQSVVVLEVTDHTAEWGGYHHGYGLVTVTTGFVAIRNTHWSAGLNREVVESHCDNVALYLFCRPKGHAVSGELETDLAFTLDGWKVLSRNYRSRSEFPLSRYLVPGGTLKGGYVAPPAPSQP